MAYENGFYSLQSVDLNGKKEDLSKYKGKVSLVVNTASKCGFTSQYEALEKIYEKYKDKNFVVLGFPSNDFGSQEPGDNEEIKKFCTLKYHVTFPLFSKSAVKSAPQNPVYDYLTHKTDKEIQGDVGWNFTKFLVDKDGKVVARFDSRVKPDDSQILEKVEKLLRAGNN